MARARNIKPGFFKNADLADKGPLAQLLFAGLWCIADRDGRLKDDPRWIRVECLPYYAITDKEVNDLLESLSSGDDPFISRYEVNGRRCIQVIQWFAHQRPHHNEVKSQIPPRLELTAADIPEAEGLVAKVASGSANFHMASIEGINKEGIRQEGIRNQESECKKPRKQFTPPTLEEVREYCRERGNSIDPRQFVDFYTSKGWLVGKVLMRDWKASVRTWERNGIARGSPHDDPYNVRGAAAKFLAKRGIDDG